MRALLLLILIMQFGAARADVYAYRDDAQGLWLTDAPRAGHQWQLLYRASDGGRPASAPLDAQCVLRLSAGPRAPGLENVAAEVNAAIHMASEKWKLDADLLRAVIWIESRCNLHAVSPKGARGLMQLMPGTAKLYGVTNAFDTRANILAGAAYLSDLLKFFSGNLELALAAYNAGPQAVVAAGGRIPPYRETQAYVPAILRHMHLLKQS